MEIRVLDFNFNLLGTIDTYESSIWRPEYYGVGDFELYLRASEKAIDLLKRERLLVRSQDVHVNSDETEVIYKKVMIVLNFNIVTDNESGDYITVTGRELKYILHKRIVWKQTNLAGTCEDGIRTLVAQNAINPSNSSRIIPNLVLGDKVGITDKVEKQITGDSLDLAIKDICTTYEIGWDVYVKNKKMIFEVYKGEDRSHGQSERPFVEFSEALDNLVNTSYQMRTEEYSNVTLIGGEGEGTDRKYASVGNRLKGLERNEIFTDARDISQTTMDATITDEQYKVLLQERGKEKLAELSMTEGFSGEVLSNNTFTYEEDFSMGDIVTVTNKYGISRNARVISTIESESSTGITLIPQFNL